MSATICPSCLSRSFEAGRCGKCGFSAAEYKPPRTALPLGAVAGNYRIGVMKTNSRQSQIYAAAHTETSAPVIIEEFFPAKIVGRKPDNPEVSLVSDDEDLAHRFQQGCLLLESSAQKRPLKRLETFRANNTVYSVFEPVATMPIAAQCERMADNPYYFRDQNGMPMMTINLLTIPPMPALRGYNEEQYKKKAPITQPSDDSDRYPGPMISENATRQKRKKLIMILGGIAAVLVVIVVIGLATGKFKEIIQKIHPTPSPSPVITEEVTATPTVTDTPTQIPDPTDTPVPEELGWDLFIPMLRVIPAAENALTGIPVDEDILAAGNYPKNAEEQVIDPNAEVRPKDGEVLWTLQTGKEKVKKLCFVLKKDDQLFLVDAGTLTIGAKGTKTFKPDAKLQGLGIKLWDKDLILFDTKDGDQNWLQTIYKDPETTEGEYTGDKYMHWHDSRIRIEKNDSPDEAQEKYTPAPWDIVDQKGDSTQTDNASGSVLMIESVEGILKFPLREADEAEEETGPGESGEAAEPPAEEPAEIPEETDFPAETAEGPSEDGQPTEAEEPSEAEQPAAAEEATETEQSPAAEEPSEAGQPAAAEEPSETEKLPAAPAPQTEDSNREEESGARITETAGNEAAEPAAEETESHPNAGPEPIREGENNPGISENTESTESAETGETAMDQERSADDQPKEETIELDKEEFISSLLLINKKGKQFTAREMKKKYRIIDDTLGTTEIDAPRKVCLGADTNAETGLILEAEIPKNKKNPVLYVMTPDDGDGKTYRIRVGYIDKKDNDTIKSEEKSVELVLELPQNLGRLPQGTKLSFETTEGESWLQTLMKTPSINDSLRKSGVKFTLTVHDDNGSSVPELRAITDREESKFPLKVYEAVSDFSEAAAEEEQ